MKPSKQHELDREHIARIQQGDKAAFEAVFLRYYDDLCGFTFHYVERPDVAQDLVHDLFLDIWRRRREWFPKGTIKSYLFMAARNRGLNYLKHRQVQRDWQQATRTDAPLPAISPESALHYKELAEAVEEAISELPERQRTALTLSWDHDLTYRDIAEVMGISIKTVETHMGRALKALRTRLSDFFLFLL